MDFQLEIERAIATYDPQTRIVTVVYRGMLDAETNATVYGWLEQLYEHIGADTLWGQVFDFRGVTEFGEDNLKAARRNSSRMNMRTKVTNWPVALIVNDFYHEEILRSSMRVAAENVRKRIVWSEQDALNFLHEWHAEHTPDG